MGKDSLRSRTIRLAASRPDLRKDLLQVLAGESSSSWVITIPKTVSWDSYQRELDVVKDGSQVMNYRVRGFPNGMKKGDRCYLVHDGAVRGWMAIVGLEEHGSPWRCSTTGQEWPAGKYIQRSGPFHKVDGPKMTGFRGVRKYNQES